jgi:hypothetical protein
MNVLEIALNDCTKVEILANATMNATDWIIWKVRILKRVWRIFHKLFQGSELYHFQVMVIEKEYCNLTAEFLVSKHNFG